MHPDRPSIPELDKSKPYIIAQLNYVRSFATEAAQKNMWYEFPQPPRKNGYARLYAGVPPTELNNFFANPPTKREIKRAHEAIVSPKVLTDKKVRTIAQKALYKPNQWLTNNPVTAQTKYAYGGFVLVVDLPDRDLSQYAEMNSGFTDELVFVIPREVVRAATIQIYKFGPESYKYFHSIA